MSSPLIVDTVTTNGMLQAFDTCNADCNTIMNSIDGAVSNLSGHWTGDAYKTYNGSMNEWLDGFHKVQTGLQQLNESMNSFRNITNNTESQNTTTSGGWAHL